ncbi:MAG: hypothetical protein IJ716_14445 [Lachnospiraceae bacterium]|nr:hypothetical protein [Lachnospiraceae bacterium]
MTRIEELEQKVKELQTEIESLKKEESKKFPEAGDDYYTISTMGEIGSAVTWTNHKTDKMRLLIGNCFKTEEEARFYIERLKVIAELRKYAEPDDTPWDGRAHYSISYDYLRNEIITPFYYNTKLCNLYFESFNKAQEAIETIGVKRLKKYYLGVAEV